MIKVGDFGLSRDIYMENYYRPTKYNKCPVKWMPPEMIRDGISTEKSDVVSLIFVILMNFIFLKMTLIRVIKAFLIKIRFIHCVTFKMHNAFDLIFIFGGLMGKHKCKYKVQDI